MGKITEWIQGYRNGDLSFDDLRDKLVAFDWKDLQWPQIFEREEDMDEGALALTDYGDLGNPEEDTLEEFDAAWDDDILTDEEYEKLYQAIWDAHQDSASSGQEAEKLG